MVTHKDYSQELGAAYEDRGFPIANPQPGFDKDGNALPRVELGDVGYIHHNHGHFVRLFNVHKPPGVEGQPREENLPEGFVKLDLDDELSTVRDSTRLFTSHSVSIKDFKGEITGPDWTAPAGGSIEFSAKQVRGAVLVTPGPAPISCIDATPMGVGRYERYAAAHARSWLSFFKSRNLEATDIVLVTGVDRTVLWATAAFAGSSMDVGFGLNIRYPLVGGLSVGPRLSWNHGPAVKTNSTPLPDTDQKDSIVQPDQTIFIRRLRMKRRRFWGITMKANAEPKDPDMGDDEDEGDGDVFMMSESPERGEFVDELTPVLDYILEHSDAQIAIAHDQDIRHFRNIASDIQDPSSRISVSDDGIGTLQTTSVPASPCPDVVMREIREDDRSARPERSHTVTISTPRRATYDLPPVIMSSDEDSANVRPRRSRDKKKRRVARSCDICRKRKVRCDGEQVPGRKCANCAAANLQCSYVQTMKKYPEGYVEALEQKLDKVDKLLKRLHPDDDFTRAIGVPITRENWMDDGVLGDPDGLDHVIPDGKESDDPSDDDQDTAIKLYDLTHSLKGTLLGVHVGAFRGKSSTASMVEAAFALKSDDPSKTNHPFVRIRRPEFWAVLPFERELLERQSSPFEFPEDDLLWHLVDRYFTHLNVITPILHRPSFEKQVREGLHLKDGAFGAVVLSVCANGARLSDDRRVLTDEGQNWYSAGWAWFSQVRMTQKALLSSSRLYDLQVLCLTVIYLHGGSMSLHGWDIAGIGLRLAQDIGAHRKKVYGDTPTAEDELFKRAFWSLLWMDRWMSALQGRTCALLDDDFDLDLPADCDDIYWDHPNPEQRFKQPPGKPSQLAYFVASAKQCQILGSALSTIYASGKARARTGAYGLDWEQRTVADFDARMNEWVESLPEHLRWRSTQQDTIFLMQSAHLHAQFYHLQILVHRPFISSRKEAHLGFRSLAVCINVARSCSRLVASLRERVPADLCPYLQGPAFTAGVMLLLGIWNIERTGISMDQGKETQAVYNCIALLKDVEKRWQSAGRLWDMLSSLVAAGGAFAGPLSVPAPTLKLARESEMTGYEPSGAPADYASPSVSASSGAHARAASVTDYSSSPFSDVHLEFDDSGPRQDMRLHAVDMSVPSTSSSDLAWGMLPVRSQELGHVALDDPIWVMSSGNFEPAFGAGEPLPLAPVQWQSDHISALANIDKLPSIARQRSAQHYAEQVRPASSYERTVIANGHEQTSPSYGLNQSAAHDQGGSGTGYTSSLQPQNPTGGMFGNYNYAGTSGIAHAYGQSFSTDRRAPSMLAGYPPMYDSHSEVVPSEWRHMSTGAIGAGPPGVVSSDYTWYDQQRQMPQRNLNQTPPPQQFGDLPKRPGSGH